MNINVQSWGSDMDQLARRMQAMMNEMRRQQPFHCKQAPPSWKPRLNVYESASMYLVCVELAGIDPNDTEVRVENGLLHIRGNRAKPVLLGQTGESASEAPLSVHLMEIDWGCFDRSLRLAGDEDLSAIRAVYRQGYLWVTLPRKRSREESGR